MVLYILEKRWEVGLRSTYRRCQILCQFWQITNHIFRWSPFWSWRLYQQAKLSHLGHRKPARRHWKADAPKTRWCLSHFPKKIKVICGPYICNKANNTGLWHCKTKNVKTYPKLNYFVRTNISQVFLRFPFRLFILQQFFWQVFQKAVIFLRILWKFQLFKILFRFIVSAFCVLWLKLIRIEIVCA